MNFLRRKPVLPTAPPTSTADVHSFIQQALGRQLSKDPASLDMAKPFYELGIDSLSAVRMSGQLAEWMKVELEPSILFEYATPAALAEHLSTLLPQQVASSEMVQTST